MSDPIGWIEKKAEEAKLKLEQQEISTVPEDISKILGQELTVSMSNSLIRAAHGLNLVEKRLVTYAMAKAESLKGNQVSLRISAKEYAKEFSVDIDSSYRELKKATDRLFSRYFSLVIDTPTGEEIHKVHWVSSAKYHKGDGWVEINFSQEATPYILLLNGKYTTYKLKMASALRSYYSWRLLELIMQWKTTKQLYITLEDFRHALGIPKSYLYKDIRVNCIEKAIKELREKDRLVIEWEPIKKGRAVKALKFTWDQEEQYPLLLD